jgi:cyclophilin family peptidyl-prolyl cis-trans isomerase
MAAVVSNLVHNHPNNLQFVFRPVPIQPINNADKSHDKSHLAVQAVIAADQQAHFWEMYDTLFQKNSEWSDLAVNEFNIWLDQQAAGIGLDRLKFESALNAEATVTQAASMFDSATQSGLQALPLVILNGKPQPLFSLDYSTLDSTISLIALGARQFKSCPAFTINPSKQYVATLHTARGDIALQLYPDKAPLAVNSFVFLARSGWYDGVTFTSVIPGFIAQAGDPSGTGNGGPGYLFKNETNSSLHFNVPGVVGMANSGPNTNGSQFFITYAPQPSLDDRYTIFGQVIAGMRVVESLTPRDPSKSPLLPPGDRIISVKIEEK